MRIHIAQNILCIMGPLAIRVFCQLSQKFIGITSVKSFSCPLLIIDSKPFSKAFLSMICFTSFTKIFHLQFIRLYEDIFPFFRNILYCTFQKLELDNFLDLTNQKLHQNGAARIFCMSPNSKGIVLTHLPVSRG